MSRKSRRNISNNAAGAKRAPALRLPYSILGVSSLALGSVAMAGTVHGQDASPGKDANAKGSKPKAAPTAQQAKSLRSKVIKVAASDTLPADGAGLVAQNDQAATASSAATVPAPTTSAEQLQEIVVTGIRASLQRSLEIKRLSLGVVDAISAEDIGQFPDASIGEAVARIPGVTVDRGSINQNSSAGAPTAMGSVTGITVRGFGNQFNELLVEGRPIASGNGQQFDWGILGAQYVGEVDVHKTPDFSLSTGAIGGTINVKFPNPFDNPGMHARAFYSTTDYANDGGFRPSFGALFSDTFADGKLGFLISGDYTDHHILGHHQDIVGWKGTSGNPTDGYLACADYAVAPSGSGCASVGTGATGNSKVPSWYPQDMAMYLERTDDRRKDGRVALQWRPMDAVLVTLDDNYSSDDVLSDRFQRSTWFGSFSDVTQDANGTMTSFINDGGSAPTDFNSFVATDYIVTNTPGINVLWDVNDEWSAELDADQSMSRLNPNGGYTDVDADTGFGSNDAVGTNNASFGLTLSQNPNVLPYWSAYGPNAVASGSGAVAAANFNGTSPFIIGSHVLPLQDQRNTDKINQVKLDATWHAGSTKVNFGAQFVDDFWNEWETDTFDFTGANDYWQLWSGYGPANNSYAYHCSGAPPYQSTNKCASQTNPGPGAVAVVHGVALPPGMFSTFNLGTWMPGYSGNGNLPSSIVEYNPYAVLNYLESQPINQDWNPTSGYPRYTGGVPTMELNAGGVQKVERRNFAPYVTAEHNFSIGDMTLKADAGLRYEKTDVTIGGYAQAVTGVGLQPGDPTAYAFNLGAKTLTTTTNSYHYFLPSLDLNLLVQPNLKVRADFSRTESTPPDNELIPNTTYGGRVNALTATGNNPDLLPYLSNNFDLGAEWYYGSNDYVSVDGFFKHVTQFPVSSIQFVTLPFNDPSPRSTNFGKPMVFSETTFTNGQEANVTGVEVIWQQMLGYGFGYQVNGTLAHTNKNFDRYSLTSGQFALPGVGNSANLIAFYQRQGFQARLAVQWQGSYLLTLGQEQGGGNFGNEPVYLASSTNLDFSTTYDITSNLAAYFEAFNLTDAVYHTYGRFSNQTLNLVDYGRSYSIGVRAKF